VTAYVGWRMKLLRKLIIIEALQPASVAKKKMEP
jgi:hypothetical protein